MPSRISPGYLHFHLWTRPGSTDLRPAELGGSRIDPALIPGLAKLGNPMVKVFVKFLKVEVQLILLFQSSLNLGIIHTQHNDLISTGWVTQSSLTRNTIGKSVLSPTFSSLEKLFCEIWGRVSLDSLACYHLERGRKSHQ
jgi:hypothetical protein